MWFDGCYRRKVRQAGVVHELVVHRVRCPRCRAGYAILPDFVVARRLDTAEVIGAAVTAAAGAPGAARGTALLAEGDLPRATPAHTAWPHRRRMAYDADPLPRLPLRQGWGRTHVPADLAQRAPPR